MHEFVDAMVKHGEQARSRGAVDRVRQQRSEAQMRAGGAANFTLHSIKVWQEGGSSDDLVCANIHKTWPWKEDG